VADLPAAAGLGPLDGLPHLPAPRARTLWSAGAGAVGFLLALVPAAGLVLVDLWPVAVVVVLAGTAIGIAFGRAVWRRRTWQLGATALELRRGVIVQRAASIPYTRIQQIDVERGPLERLAGLSQLVVRTAAATSDGALYGLVPDDASRIRSRLLEVAGVDDAV
jgi:membrane protein YdbS with pleckstrin-like domain